MSTIDKYVSLHYVIEERLIFLSFDLKVLKILKYQVITKSPTPNLTVPRLISTFHDLSIFWFNSSCPSIDKYVSTIDLSRVHDWKYVSTIDKFVSTFDKYSVHDDNTCPRLISTLSCHDW